MLVVIRENEVNFALNQIFLQRLEIYHRVAFFDNNNIDFALFCMQNTYATYLTNKLSGKKFADILYPSINP